MSITEAINFGRTKIGRWHYCTDNRYRFGQADTCADCSGFVSRCLWEGGMPRYTFPENSADIARYFQYSHPERRLSIDAAKRTYGAVLVKGGIFGYGPRGHVVFSLGNGLQTLESSGSGHGVGIQSINRLTWSHAGLPPIAFVAPPPPKPPAPPPPPIAEENMQVIIYKGTAHTFWVDENGWLQHNWGPNSRENMRKYTKEQMKFDQAPGGVSLAVNGDWLNVRAVAVPLPAPNGRRVIAYDFHPSSGWHPYAAVPTA